MAHRDAQEGVNILGSSSERSGFLATYADDIYIWKALE